jgi:integrase
VAALNPALAAATVGVSVRRKLIYSLIWQSHPVCRAANRGKTLELALTPDAIYKMVKAYSAELGFEIGAHALRATAATNALDHQADIAKVQEWLGLRETLQPLLRRPGSAAHARRCAGSL